MQSNYSSGINRKRIRAALSRSALCQELASRTHKLAKGIALFAVAWWGALGIGLSQSSLTLPREGTNVMSLRVHSGDSKIQSHPAGAFEITAFGQTLLTDAPAWHPSATNPPVSILVLESASSNNWEYLRVDLSSAAPECSRWHRHLLFVAPNLFAMLDEIDLSKPGYQQAQLHSQGGLMLEARSRDFRVEMTNAGLTAHVFEIEPKHPGSWQSNRLGSGVTFTSISTNQVEHLRRLTLAIPHARGRKGGTGFKLLESDSAIGARIWRDGLPTLIAFRTTPPGTESSLASMSVVGPVAVDVFDPSAVRKRKVFPVGKRGEP